MRRVWRAYALSRYRIRGRKNILLWYLGLLMAPPVAFLIPYSVLASAVGLKGSYLSMILILQTLTIPFSIWLMKSFIDEGDKVKVTLRFRGREMAHQDIGVRVLERIRADMDVQTKVEQMPRMENRQMVMVLTPR